MKNFKQILMAAVLSISGMAALLTSAGTQAQEVRSYFVSDAVGSPVIATDANANVTWSEDYLPYGERRYRSASSGSNERWFTGAPQNEDTGLIDLGNRQYDPVVGRFLSIDPVGASAGQPFSVNRYAYANNNPYKFVDPNGLEVMVVFSIRSVKDVPNYAHTYVQYYDTQDHKKSYIFRAGPDRDVVGSVAAVLNTRTMNDTGDGYVKLRADNDPSEDSREQNTGGMLADFSIVDINFDDAKNLMDDLAAKINKADIPYQPQGPNSNTAAASAYKELTGRAPKPVQYTTSKTILGLDDKLPVQPTAKSKD